jgi:hypothetical protein
MAQYLILLFEPESFYVNADPTEIQGVMDAHNRFTKQVAATGGSVISGNALQPTATATTIRADIVTDGPFVETKEALGGYYLVEAADLDQAIAIGKLVPAFGPGAGVEIRPIMVFDQA